MKEQVTGTEPRGAAVARSPEVEAQLAVFKRASVDLIDEEDLARAIARSLAERKPLRVKLGLDPSSPDLHVGHAIQLKKLREIQDLGHTVVLIIGSATAMVGDPSGRNKLRPQLSREDVEANLRTYAEQASLVLDMERVERRLNSEWFDRMGFQEVLRLCGRMTVARMLERDTFQKRVQASEPIGIHEFLYPLMQGWDSVVVEADVEFGGTDQLFNLLVGRDLLQQEGKRPQVCITHPLINGLDGRKMSKSYGNAVGLTDPPREMFGKIMSLADDEMAVWFECLTRVPPGELATLLAGHPRQAKARLAWEVTAWLHDAPAADDAREAFDRQFRDKELPDDIPDVSWPEAARGQSLPLANVLRELGLAKSTSDARRLVQQGGVKLAGEPASDPMRTVTESELPLLVQVGKRRFVRLVSL